MYVGQLGFFRREPYMLKATIISNNSSIKQAKAYSVKFVYEITYPIVNFRDYVTETRVRIGGDWLINPL